MNWDWLALIGVGLAVVFLVAMVRISASRSRKGPPPHPVQVSLTDSGFAVSIERGPPLMIRWLDIQKVTIIMTDEGPWVDDLFFHIIHAGGDLTLPDEAGGMPDFVEKLVKLPGFDMDAYTQAIRSTQNNTFVVCLNTLT
ncbi:hypothetical protein PQU92_04835 [Asticcacaulis sp. BYS171W]|uniref:Cell division protein ZipA n=1 Tax=Asticcacaulis aquaticus TaxID=2984212 RepID=A0ABT5HR86_9CAUL|nr:hypothetical protein [Asticcacaulis aquaticus]MDC7682588.1 hypothetical protein [Asticcacaulis aquaticus]